MSLDLTPFVSAVQQLEDTLNVQRAYADGELAPFLRAASIQAFQYTYELCWKLLKRFLRADAANAAEFEHMSFGQLIRSGNAKGLLKHEVEIWRKYRDSRNLTSHTYDPLKAEAVFVQIPGFLEDAQYLLAQL